MGKRVPGGPGRYLYGFHYVYFLRAPDSETPHYVGFTSSPRTRWQGHVDAARNSVRRGVAGQPLYDWILGLLALDQRPVMVVVDQVAFPPGVGCLDRVRYEVRARELEEAWIAKFLAEGAPLLNERRRRDEAGDLCEGCGGAHGFRFCPTRERSENSLYSAKSHDRAVAAGLCRNCRAPRGDTGTATLCRGCADGVSARRRARRSAA